jgi:hypothetical protein
MARKRTNFIRKGSQYELFQIGKNYTEERKQIELTLEQMFEDSKKEGIIHSLRKYKNEFMTGVYLQRLIELGILKSLPSSNNNTQYKWAQSDSPDFTKLTSHILEGPKSEKKG